MFSRAVRNAHCAVRNGARGAPGCASCDAVRRLQVRGPEALAAFQEQHAALTAKLEGMEAETAEFVRTFVQMLAPFDSNLPDLALQISCHKRRCSNCQRGGRVYNLACCRSHAALLCESSHRPLVSCPYQYCAQHALQTALGDTVLV